MDDSVTTDANEGENKKREHAREGDIETGRERTRPREGECTRKRERERENDFERERTRTNEKERERARAERESCAGTTTAAMGVSWAWTGELLPAQVLIAEARDTGQGEHTHWFGSSRTSL